MEPAAKPRARNRHHAGTAQAPAIVTMRASGLIASAQHLSREPRPARIVAEQLRRSRKTS